MKSQPSPTVERLLAQQASNLPSHWFGPDGPVPEARAEIACACLFRIVAHLLFMDELPEEVRVGREGARVRADAPTWSALQAELGLDGPDERSAAAQRLWRVLRPDPSRPPGRRAPPGIAGVARLGAVYARQQRRGRGRPPVEEVREELGRAPLDSELAAFIAWAGGLGEAPEALLGAGWHALWKPLSRRAWTENTPMQAPAPLVLPTDFLRRAPDTRGRALRPEPPGSEPSEPTERPTEDPRGEPGRVERREREPLRENARAPLALREVPSTEFGLPRVHAPAEATPLARLEVMPRDPALEEALVLLAEPFLALPTAPADVIDAAIEHAPALARDVLRAWRRALLAGQLDLFGTPGEHLQLVLPDRDWRLEAGPTRASGGWYRVTRRGVRFQGRVIQPGAVVSAGGPG